MLSFKEGCRIDGLKPEILAAVPVILEVFRKYGYDMTITEGTGGTHMHNSLHYKGLALDIRSKHITSPSVKSKILFDCVIMLDSNYDFIIENEGQTNEHFHAEYQPKESI